MLGRYIHMATNNAATQYLIAIILCILSFSVNLYRVSIFHEDLFILFQPKNLLRAFNIHNLQYTTISRI